MNSHPNEEDRSYAYEWWIGWTQDPNRPSLKTGYLRRFGGGIDDQYDENAPDAHTDDEPDEEDDA